MKEKRIQNADIWAGFSFVGILVWPAGIIGGLVSLTKTEKIQPENDLDAYRLRGIKIKATWAVILTLVSFAVTAIFVIFQINQRINPDEVNKNYMAACVNNGSYSYCRCTLDYLSDHYTLQEYINMEKRLKNTGYVPNGIQKAYNACT